MGKKTHQHPPTVFLHGNTADRGLKSLFHTGDTTIWNIYFNFIQMEKNWKITAAPESTAPSSGRFVVSKSGLRGRKRHHYTSPSPFGDLINSLSTSSSLLTAGQSESAADRGGDVQSDGDLQAVQNYPRSVLRPHSQNAELSGRGTILSS